MCVFGWVCVHVCAFHSLDMELPLSEQSFNLVLSALESVARKMLQNHEMTTI